MPRLLSLVPALATCVPFLSAAEPDQETLVITATRLEADPFAQPYAVHRIDREAIDASAARTLSDVIDRTPGLVVQRTATNQASPFLRGLTGEQTLLLFDGVRLNNALFRPGANQYSALIPAEAIDHVDVILGAGATAMGSDGLTGAVDHRLAPAGRGQEKSLSPWAASRYGSAEGPQISAGVDGRAGAWAYSVDGSYATCDDLRGGGDAGDRLYGPAAGSRDIPNTDYDQYSLGARAAFLGLAGHRFEAAVGRVQQQDAERPDGYYENSGKSSRLSRYYDPQTFDYAHLKHEARDLGPWSLVASTLWWHRQDEEQVREDVDGSGATARYRRRVYEDRIDTLGADVQFGHCLGQHRPTYGATVFRDAIDTDYARYRSPAGSLDPAVAVQDQSAATNPGNTTVPDGSHVFGWGLFAQDAWAFAPAWELLAGLRYDRFDWSVPITADRAGYAAYGTSTIDDDADAISGSLRLSWFFSEPFMTYTGISQGFRAPTVSDLAGAQDRASSSSGGTGPQTEGNPGLDPERSLTLEWGLKWQQGSDSASLAVFQTRLSDLIQVQYIDVDANGAITSADRARSINVSDGTIAGGEIASDIGLPLAGLPAGWRLSLFQATSLVSGEADVPQVAGGEREEHLSKANQLFGRLGAKVAADETWYALAQVRWADAYDEAAPGDATDTRHTTAGHADGSMSGWGVLDLKGGWRRADGRLRIDGGLENVLDHTYRQVGSGIDGAGLNAVIAVSTRW